MSNYENHEPDNPSAFPRENIDEEKSGMFLLDYFAAKAMQTLLNKNLAGSNNQISEKAYSIAEAMLKERSKHL